MGILVTVMRSPRVKAKLFEKAVTIASRKSADGRVLETLAIPAGNYAVDDGSSIHDIGRDAFENRFLRIGKHYVELGRSFASSYENGALEIGGGLVSCSEVDDLVWCDRSGGPIAFLSDPLDVVLQRAIARGPIASAVVEVLVDLRARMSPDEYTDEMREFDRLYAQAPDPIDTSREARIAEIEKALSSQVMAIGIHL